MATKKKAPRDNTWDQLDAFTMQVYNAYNNLFNRLKRVPNNKEIAKQTRLSLATVTKLRSELVKLKLAQPSPRGPSVMKTKVSTLLTETPKIVEHQMLPDDNMQTAAMVLALPTGPLANIAAAIRDQLVKLDASRERLMAALTALGES